MSLLLVVDASVAAKWLFREADQELAYDLVGRFELIAPDLLLVECGNVIWQRNRRGEVSAGAATRLVAQLRAGPVRCLPTEALVERAVALGVALKHPIYDCVYLSLALAANARVVTSDRGFARAARGNDGLAARVVLLSELAH